MLGKLFRQEIKSQSRMMLGIYGVMAASAVFISLLGLVRRMFENAAVENFFIVSGSLYILTMAVCTAAGFIYLCMHFYQSMYSAQGYLTHTLPVETSQILNVKVIVSAGSLFLTAVFCILSLCTAGAVWDGLDAGEFFHLFTQAFAETGRQLNIHGAALFLSLAALTLLACINYLLLFFAGSSIGQLAKRSKGACGIAASIALYYVCQIISLIAIVIPAISFIESGRQPETWIILCGAAAVILFWIAVFYMICRVIAQKHLNLE